MMKNGFHCTLNALFVLKIFKYLFWQIFQKNGLIRINLIEVNITLISKLITSQTEKQTPAINTKIVRHPLPDISRSKGNQIMKFGQLIEYNMRNLFYEKSYKKWGGEPDCFLKNQNWAYFWINSLKFYASLFLLYAKLKAIEIYWN